MLLRLVKKDFQLAKKYWIIMLIAAIVLPVFIHTKIPNISGAEFLSFFLSTLYIVFLLFSTVSLMEDKYRGGSVSLCNSLYEKGYRTIKVPFYYGNIYRLLFLIYPRSSLQSR